LPVYIAYGHTNTSAISLYSGSNIRISQGVKIKSAFTLTQVAFLLAKSGSPTGTITVAIKAVDGSGYPTGADLDSDTLDISTLLTAYTWNTFNLDYSLVAGTTYAFVVRYSGGNSSNYLSVRATSAEQDCLEGIAALYVSSWSAGNTTVQIRITGTGLSIPFFMHRNFVFSPSSTGWQNVTAYTSWGLPPNAIADVICRNANGASPRTLGVRTDGSSLTRSLELHEAEGGGVTTLEMLVTVDSSGVFETYCNTATGVSFRVTGVWMGATFTEKDNLITVADVDGWWDLNVNNSPYSVPLGSTCQFACINNFSGVEMGYGVRTDGSSLARFIVIAESETQGINSYSNFVKSHATTGIVEFYEPPAGSTNNEYMLLGYFDNSSMDFAELWTQKTMSSDSTWEDKDLTSDLDEDGRVVNFVLVHEDANSNTICGARRNGGVLTRYEQEHEAEAGGNTGFGITVQSDSSGIVELYCQDASESLFMLSGYFIPSAGITTYTETFNIDTLFKKLDITDGFNVDSAFQKQDITSGFNLDTIFASTISKTFNLDTVFERMYELARQIDVIFKRENITQTFDIDTLFQTLGITEDFLIDVIFLLAVLKTFNIDAVFKREDILKTFLIDALFKKLDITSPFNLDALFQKQDLLETFNLDTAFQRELTTTFNLDSAFEKEILKTFLIDAIFKKLDITSTFNLDVIFSTLGTAKTFDIDALFQLEKTIQRTVDALFQLQDQTRTFDLDTLFALAIAKGFNLDTLFKRLDLTDSFNLDIIFKKADILKTFGLDALFEREYLETFALDVAFMRSFLATWNLDTLFEQAFTQTFNVDSLFKKLDNLKTFNVDTAFLLGFVKTFGVDTLFRRLDIVSSFGIDTVFVTGIVTYTNSFLLDTLFRDTITSSFSLDVIFGVWPGLSISLSIDPRDITIEVYPRDVDLDAETREVDLDLYPRSVDLRSRKRSQEIEVLK
jgi:hypothetical protein